MYTYMYLIMLRQRAPGGAPCPFVYLPVLRLARRACSSAGLACPRWGRYHQLTHGTRACRNFILPAGRWPLAAGRWLLAAGRWPLAAGRWPLAAGCWLLAAGRWPLAAGRWPLAAGCWLLAAGRWPLAAGRWLLAAGCWPLAAGRWPLAAGRWPQLFADLVKIFIKNPCTP